MSRPYSSPKRDAPLRLALRLERHLENPSAAFVDPVLHAAGEMVLRLEPLRGTLTRHQLVTGRWSAAAARTGAQIASQLRELTYELNCLNHTIPSRRCPATAGQILIDLRALDEEFNDLQIADDLSCLSVVTDAIVLEEIELGRFRIELDLRRLLRGYRDSGVFNLIALDPNPSARDQSVVHPHVQGTGICLGDGVTAVNAALADGRIYDAIQIVSRVLHTYNDGSPYVSLDSWHGVRCDECDGVTDEDELYSCQRCGSRMCSGCEHACCDCEESYCRQCLERDEDDLVCTSCLESRESNREEEEDDLPDEPEEPQPKETDHEPAPTAQTG